MRAWELYENKLTLYHTTSAAIATEIMNTGVIKPKHGEAFVSFSKKPFTGDISHNDVTLEIDASKFMNEVMPVVYTEEWFNQYPDHASYVAGEGWQEQFMYPDDCYDDEGFGDTDCEERAYREAELDSFLCKDDEEEIVSKVMGKPIQIRGVKILEGEKADLPDIEVGDELRTGKFKNRKVTVKGFKKDKNNHPVAKTTNGDVPLLKPRVTKLMSKEIDEGTPQNEAEAYAARHGMEIAGWEGSGDMGEAYVTNKDTIIKVTTDKTEMAFAALLVGKKLTNVVDIYDVENHIIHMEYLDTSDNELWYEIMNFDEHGDGIEYMDGRDYDDMSDEAKKMLDDLQIGMRQLAGNGVRNLDLKDDNFGKKQNGNYAIFDMSDAKRGMW